MLVGLLFVSVFCCARLSVANGGDASAYWLNLADIAWRYYQPGAGVYAITGLHFADIHYQYFTDWDLGVYFRAILDAEALGLITRDGSWGADYRLNKLLVFLENRPLRDDGQPHYWYSAATGQNSSNVAPIATDTGNLLVALANLKLHRPDLASRIDAVVYTRTNYEPMKQKVDLLSGSLNIYDYHVAYGFACFWPERFSAVAEAVLTNILSADTVDYNGVTLPRAKLLCEPMLLHFFGAPQRDLRVWSLLSQVYDAHEARYDAAGKFTAFTEGQAPSGGYVWEWVVLPDGRTWIIRSDETTDVAMTPLVYLKVAASFLALYNTSYAASMVDHIVSRISYPGQGYAEGVDEDGQALSTVSDKTNGMILSAARYAIENGAGSLPSPTPSPSSSPTPSPSSSPSPSPSPTPSPSSSPSPSPSPSPAASQLVIANFTQLFSAGSAKVIYPSDTASPKPLGCGAASVSDWLASAFISSKLLSFTEGLDTESAFVNQASGKAVGASQTGIVSFGGPFVNPVVKYAEGDSAPEGDQAPVRFQNDVATFRFKQRSGTAIAGASLPVSVVNHGQDMFVIEVYRDIDERNVMLCYGFGWKGTYAAGKYFDQIVYPNLYAYTFSWIVVKWDDTNGNGFVNNPGDGDTYTLIAFG